jgi:hypothetical protein
MHRQRPGRLPGEALVLLLEPRTRWVIVTTTSIYRAASGERDRADEAAELPKPCREAEGNRGRY